MGSERQIEIMQCKREREKVGEKKDERGQEGVSVVERGEVDI